MLSIESGVCSCNLWIKSKNFLWGWISIFVERFSDSGSSFLVGSLCVITISLSIDQGSKFWAATWFMPHYLHLRMATVFDPHHRCWNDIMDALGACGLKHLVFEYLIVLNLAHEPWKSCEFWRQLQKGMGRYLGRGSLPL